MYDQLKELNVALVELALEHKDCLEEVCTEEMGEVIDMIKDLTEAMYHCQIIKAMEEHPEEIINHLKT